tara:strand:- start:531 stop:959 length:429 start_codon:yes stop_codon:yes gene_type:complete
VAGTSDSEKVQMHGTTGSGNVLPISAITQETSTSMLFTRQGREDFASTTHPRMQVPSHTVAKQLPLLCGLNDVVAQTGFLLTADSSNTITVMIGGKTVSTTDGLPLVAGQSLMIDIVRLSKIYAIAATDPSSGTCNLFWLDM